MYDIEAFLVLGTCNTHKKEVAEYQVLHVEMLS
jgi:hypothetical protein